MSATKPFISCEYCGRVCEFKVPASALKQTQKLTLVELTNDILENKYESAVKTAMEKAAEMMNQKLDVTSIDQRGLAYCILAQIVADLEFKDDKEKVTSVMKTLKKTSLSLMKEVEEISKEIKSSSESESPQKSAEELTQEDLKAKREALRKKQEKEISDGEKDHGAPGEQSIGQQILNWLKSDAKFMKEVKSIDRITGGLLITYDPESEGYISNLKLQFAQKSFNLGDEVRYVTKLRIITSYDIKYGQHIAIGFGTKKRNQIVFKSFFGALPKSEEEIAEALESVNPKDISDQDRLTIIFNNDKKLKKLIEALPLKSPYTEKVPNITVPVLLRSEGDKVEINCTIFFDPRSRPYDIFLGAIETIADDLDSLYDVDEKVRTKSAKEASLFEVNIAESSSNKFHFISTSNAALEVKTCPNCNRPFPDPNAEYRRCPYCLFKLM